MNYLLLTIVRDEAEHLPRVIEAIRKQTQLPELWLIVDDGSRDRTDEILASAKEKWLVTKRLNDRLPRSSMHYGQLLAEYTDYAVDMAAQCKMSWEALAVMDGDVIPEPEYFASLADALKEDGKIGIISGELVESKSTRPVAHRRDAPWSAAIAYRRDCLEAIGGLSPTPSHDSVERIMAQTCGWRMESNDNVCFEHLRPMGSSNGWYHGHAEMGRAARWLGMPISFALAKAIKLTLSRHPKRGLGYLAGYTSWRGGRCQIPEVQAAYGRRWREWWNARKK